MECIGANDGAGISWRTGVVIGRIGIGRYCSKVDGKRIGAETGDRGIVYIQLGNGTAVEMQVPDRIYYY